MVRRNLSGGVNPIVGTILMVAITIVLAVVLWLMVNDMVTEDETETIDISGVVIDKSEEPGYWIIVENEENGKKYIIESKVFWLSYDIDDDFDEKDISMDVVEKV